MGAGLFLSEELTMELKAVYVCKVLGAHCDTIALKL